eukprot:14050729-Heterocapsa_arctica.AAC.1
MPYKLKRCVPKQKENGTIGNLNTGSVDYDPNNLATYSHFYQEWEWEAQQANIRLRQTWELLKTSPQASPPPPCSLPPGAEHLPTL